VDLLLEDISVSMPPVNHGQRFAGNAIVQGCGMPRRSGIHELGGEGAPAGVRLSMVIFDTKGTGADSRHDKGADSYPVFVIDDEKMWDVATKPMTSRFDGCHKIRDHDDELGIVGEFVQLGWRHE